MSKGQRRKRLVLLGEFSQLRNDIHQFFLYQLQGLIHNDNIGIVAYIAGCSAQVDDPLGFGTLHSIGIHMGHDIMADFLLRACATS